MAAIQVSTQLRICSHCGQAPQEPKHCGNCHQAIYCGRECQRSHWNQHRTVCRAKDPKVEKAAAVVIASKRTLMKRKLDALQAKWREYERPDPTYWMEYAVARMDEPAANFQIKKAEEGEIAIDLGASYGRVTRALLGKGYRVLAIDFFEGFSKFITKALPSENLTALEKSFEPSDLPQNQKVSLIFAADFFPFLPPENFISSLQAIYDSLKPGGKCYLTLLITTEATLDMSFEFGIWSLTEWETMNGAMEELGFSVKRLSHKLNPQVSIELTKKVVEETRLG